jgi:hypothetical protein
VTVETPSWRAVHVYYYDEDKDGLLLDAVRPLLRRIAGNVHSAYFVRHWRYGPHVRIPVRCTPSAFRSVVEPAVTDIVEGYLARRPSTVSLPPEHVLLPMHQRLAEMELEPGPLRPLVPDNNIVFTEHDRRLHTLGGDVGSDLLAEFYAATNNLAFAMLEEIRGGRSREFVGLSLMLAIAHSFGGEAGIARGFVSFRSHSEAFLHGSSDPEGIRTRFDRQYRANAGALTALVRSVLDTVDGRADAVPFANEWVGALRPFWVRSEPLVLSGQLRLTSVAPGDGGDGGGDGEGADRRTATGKLDNSPMHRLMFGSDRFRRLVFDDPRFTRYRLVLNYTYLHLARLGIMGYARFRLCHLAANAVEDALGVSALKIVQDVAMPAPSGGDRTGVPA